MTDLVVAFVLFTFMLVLMCFLCCYRFLVNKDLYIAMTQGRAFCLEVISTGGVVLTGSMTTEQ